MNGQEWSRRLLESGEALEDPQCDEPIREDRDVDDLLDRGWAVFDGDDLIYTGP